MKIIYIQTKATIRLFYTNNKNIYKKLPDFIKQLDKFILIYILNVFCLTSFK